MTSSPKSFFFAVLFILSSCISSFGYEYDGILTSQPNRPLHEDQRNQKQQMVQQYIQQVMINMTIKTVGNVIDRMTKGTQAQLLPDFGYVAAQQGALQCFKQAETLKIIKDTYNNLVDGAMQEMDQGVDSNLIQQHILDQSESQLSDLSNSYVFRQIVQLVTDQAWRNQQMLIQQKTLEQGLKNLAQQQHQVQQELQQQYTQSVGSQLVK